ncbi:MAG: hypothetical protein Metus_0201 [Candidatus Methanosuratincola subterraneus]|uniref:Uncharacterized protein n=1 Tax=Methanosuratincola subterraneus TaxID=2593994 RepID=A0A444L9A5_METS7|nr:MAG: hypothetical protein Metus_0201 [Candidatus Methanosuratincola subterraneus]
MTPFRARGGNPFGDGSFRCRGIIIYLRPDKKCGNASLPPSRARSKKEKRVVHPALARKWI